MTISWSDFFRPDAHSSNRALKKFLQSEGLELGHRDLVLLRKLSDSQVFLSYAALESWAEGELQRELLEEVLGSLGADDRLRVLLEKADLCTVTLDDGPVLIGIEGECGEQEPPSSSGSTALVRAQQQSSTPLTTVYGGGDFAVQPAAGGAWTEERLQADSLVLLDGESPQELIESFRHLFRAAPSGSARASVVVAALSRHRAELDLEVAEKMEEIAPALGQAMRQLFEEEVGPGCRALQFLLNSEVGEKQPEWSGFWQQIRPTILSSLARTERGTDILLRSIDHLAAVISGDQFLNHALLEALLERLDELSPVQQEKLIGLIGDWARSEPEGSRLLRSRLELTGVQNQRLLLGESLRRTYVALNNQSGLRELARIFVAEAISAGSTAGSIALAELLRSFGTLVLEPDSGTDAALSQLTERQTLNLLEVWELMVAHNKDYLPRVIELYLNALQEPDQHLSLLLKSELLQSEPVLAAFKEWLERSDFATIRQVMSAGYNWSLTVVNRLILANVLRQVEWGFQDSWDGEWRRPHLSFQRLGWLALCAPPEQVEFSAEIQEQITELLTTSPTQLYFWELQKRCAEFDSFPVKLRERQLEACAETFEKLDSSQEEEMEALFEVGAEAARKHPEGSDLLRRWPPKFKEGSSTEVWWYSGVLEKLYRTEREAPEPPRELVSAVILRLMSSGEKSMNDLLSKALAATEVEEPLSSDDFLPLPVSNRAYLALSFLSAHRSCPGSLQPTVRRRLVLFLISWANQLRETNDPYSFRETPLFAIVLQYLEDPALQELLRETSELFLELHRKMPDKLRLEVRHTAQQLFRSWAEKHPEEQTAQGWLRVL